MNIDRKIQRPIVLANHKGGVWKTSTAIAICDIAQMAGLNLRIFSIDRQTRLLGYFVGVTEVHLPDSESLAADDIADARALEAPLQCLLDPTEDLVVVDIGANNVSRVAQAALAIGFENDVPVDCAPIVIVPTTSDPASMTAARETLEMLSIAFGQNTSFVLGCCGAGFNSNSENRDFITLKSRCDDCINILNMGPTTIRAYERSGKLPSTLAELEKRDLAIMFGETPIAAAYLNNRIMIYMSCLINECQRVFDFQSQENAVQSADTDN